MSAGNTTDPNSENCDHSEINRLNKTKVGTIQDHIGPTSVARNIQYHAELNQSKNQRAKSGKLGSKQG